MSELKWLIFPCKSIELQLLGTLNGGQSFRWKKLEKENETEWIGIFAHRLWNLKQETNKILYRVYGKTDTEYQEDECNVLLKNYFQLDINLAENYKKWSEADPYFAKAAKQFYGIRVLRQDVTENLFSFLCSSNNNIARISSMVEKLASGFGTEICELDGVKYYDFPDISALAKCENLEESLRKLNFGYRAGYISKTVKYINANGGPKWFEELKQMDYQQARITLMNLTGIGAKIADCICLMSLGHLQAVPVDTHIYQVASKLYLPHLQKRKNLNDSAYNEIGNHFRQLYGPMAGWAQTVLFCADLKMFQ